MRELSLGLRPRRFWFLAVALVLSTIAVIAIVVWLSTLRESNAAFAIRIDSYDILDVEITIRTASPSATFPSTAAYIETSRAVLVGPLSVALYLDPESDAEFIEAGFKGGLRADLLDLRSPSRMMLFAALNDGSQTQLMVVDQQLAQDREISQLEIRFEKTELPPSPFQFVDDLGVAATSVGIQSFTNAGSAEVRTLGGDLIPQDALSGSLGEATWSLPPREFLFRFDPTSGELLPQTLGIVLSDAVVDRGTVAVPPADRMSLSLSSSVGADLVVNGGEGEIYVNGDLSSSLARSDTLNITPLMTPNRLLGWSLTIRDSGVELSGSAEELRIDRARGSENLMPARSDLDFASWGTWVALFTGIYFASLFAFVLAHFKSSESRKEAAERGSGSGQSD